MRIGAADDIESTSAVRAAWMVRRAEMEARDEKHTPFGTRSRRWGEFKRLMPPFRLLLRASRLYGPGARRAFDVRLIERTLRFADLPKEFDGFRLLHLTDLHIDGMPGMAGTIVRLVGRRSVELCAWTGDYRWRVHGPYEQVLPDLANIAAAIPAADGHFVTLGNHDPVAMVEPLERLGLRVLANETISLRRDRASLHLTGLDDVHYFYTEAAAKALADAPAGFRIALVHSPEAAHLAAAAGYSLYLCGHTHGGQVCLPGGMPILTNSLFHWRHAKGLWRRGNMTGYTSNGAGTSGLPVRFFSHGEITLFTLRRAAP